MCRQSAVVARKEALVDNEFKRRRPLKRRYAREIRRIATLLRDRYAAQKIVLFGSCGRGSADEDSDIDLLIVKATTKRPLDRVREVYELLYSPQHYLVIDPLVYTPEELRQRLASGDLFLRDIVREGKVL
jgi:predicted nucleotidyltransferase